MQQWNKWTIGNYGHEKTRENNGHKYNSNNGTMGAIVLRDKGQVTMQQGTIEII